MSEVRRPKVGLGVFVFKGDHFLIGLRKGAHDSGVWAPPGGHIEWFESFEETAKREVLEETGLRIKNFRFVTAINDIFVKDDKHYVTIVTATDWVSGEPQVIEPDKCLEWRWHKWGTPLPGKSGIPLANFIKTCIDPRPTLKAT